MKKRFPTTDGTTAYTPPEPTLPVETTAPVENTAVKTPINQVKYRKVVYLGVSDKAIRLGAVTRNRYVFSKDSYRMPLATEVDERDYPSLVAEKGRGCARRSPEILFMSETEWNLELEQARLSNSK